MRKNQEKGRQLELSTPRTGSTGEGLEGRMRCGLQGSRAGRFWTEEGLGKLL